jgi:3-oxoadipate enol-lactonase
MYLCGTRGDLRRTPNIFASPLSKHFEVLAFDQRGMGRTDKPDKAYSMKDYADDAFGLLQEIGWRKSHVLGVSFGGMVAQEFAIRYPLKVDKVILACTSSGGVGGSQYPLHELSVLPFEERAKHMIGLSDSRYNEVWQKENPDEFKEIIKRKIAGLKWAQNEPESEVGARRQLKARAEHDTYERLKEIHKPVYVCGGIYDRIAPPENLKALQRQIPKSKLEFFEGGHGFLFEDPKAFEQIIQFLKI